MNVLDLLRIGKRIKVDSVAQLREDFTLYPPVPLNAEGVSHEFDVCVVSPHFFGIKALLSTLRLANKEDRSVPPGAPPELLRIIKEVDQSVSDCRRSFEGLSVAKKALFIVLIVLLSPLIIVLIAFMVLKTIVKARKTLRNVQAFMNPADARSGKRSQIVVSSSLVREAPDSLYPIVSHEHIHLLQLLSRSREGAKRASSSPSVHKRGLLLSEKAVTEVFISEYLFNEKEVEARLHELVLCYYRTHGSLPVTVSSMAEMVLQNLDVSLPWIYDSDLGESKGKVLRKKLKRYGCSTRSKEIDRHFYLMSSAIKDLRTANRYLYEILPILYCRLLRYYGGVKESEELLSQIPRPNFYDQLYGSCG